MTIAKAPKYETPDGGMKTADGVMLVAPDGSFSTGASNVKNSFRESFETLDLSAWTITPGNGDIIQVDGNTAGASYLDISKSPWIAGNETEIESVFTFSIPAQVFFAASRSQATLGQEFSFEVVSTNAPMPDISDIPILAISQAASVLTIDFATPHGLVPGKCFGVRDCSNQLANYPALVIASIPSPTQITATAGPGGTIPSQTITNPAGAKGFLFFRERFGRASNGISQIFENATATNAGLYVRAENGDGLPSGTIVGSHMVSVGSTASTQLVNSPFCYSFTSSSIFALRIRNGLAQWLDVPIDSLAQPTARLTRTQVAPGYDHTYRLRIRANNSKSLTVLTAKVVSVVKTGTTTGTFTTETPHGLVTGDLITYYGNSNTAAAAFPNLTAATAVTVIDATTFTVAIIGTASTVTGYGGVISKVQGGNLPSALGANANSAVNATLTTLADGQRQLVLTGAAAWSGLLNGDYVEVAGVTNVTNGATLGVDGVWKVAASVTTALTLVPATPAFAATIPANFGTTTSAGAVIKRTCLRVSFISIVDWDVDLVEWMPGATGDLSGAAPVVLQGGSAAFTLSSGTLTTLSALTGGGVAEDAAAGLNPVVIGGAVRTAPTPTSFVAGDAIRQTFGATGAAINKPYAVTEAGWNFTGQLTTATATAASAAAGAGLKRYITALQAFNTGGTAIDLIILDGATERWRGTIQPNSPLPPTEFPTELITTANTALNINLSAVGTVRVNLQGYTAP